MTDDASTPAEFIAECRLMEEPATPARWYSSNGGSALKTEDGGFVFQSNLAALHYQPTIADAKFIAFARNNWRRLVDAYEVERQKRLELMAAVWVSTVEEIEDDSYDEEHAETIAEIERMNDIIPV